MSAKLITLIVPVYNEEETIPIFYKEIRTNLERLTKEAPLNSEYQYELLFINDGSKDSTEKVLSDLSESDPNVKVVNFTRNFGKEAAMFAGLDHCSGEAIIPIDVDLQDPLDVIPQMLQRYEKGADVVLAKRADRSTDSFLKRKTAEWFYSLHNLISPPPKIEPNVGDFRLMSRAVVENVKLLRERNVFMKGLLSWPGAEHIEIVEYVRNQRVAGQSKFNAWKLWNFALDGITSFSTAPLRIWTYIGLIISSLSFLYALKLIIGKLVFDNPVPGYPSVMVGILFLGGVQLIGIGVLGEYIGRIYTEVKNRPRYIVKNKKGFSDTNLDR